MEMSSMQGLEMRPDMQGLCMTHENPDLWFEDSGDLFERRKGSKNPLIKFAIRKANMIQAIEICNKCPIRTNCLNEGLKDENLDYGIWGGLLPGERIVMVDKIVGATDRKYRVVTAQNIRSSMK